jgi:hypothetical protein
MSQKFWVHATNYHTGISGYLRLDGSAGGPVGYADRVIVGNARNSKVKNLRERGWVIELVPVIIVAGDKVL